MNNKITRALMIILLMLVSFELSLFLHELGHLVMGKRSGYSFVSFRVGLLVLVKEEGKWKLKKNLNGRVYEEECFIAKDRKPVPIY